MSSRKFLIVGFLLVLALLFGWFRFKSSVVAEFDMRDSLDRKMVIQIVETPPISFKGLFVTGDCRYRFELRRSPGKYLWSASSYDWGFWNVGTNCRIESITPTRFVGYLADKPVATLDGEYWKKFEEADLAPGVKAK